MISVIVVMPYVGKFNFYLNTSLSILSIREEKCILYYLTNIYVVGRHF